MNRSPIRASLRRAGWAAVLASTLPAGVVIAAAPTGDALDRPAVIARDASHAVLLAAAQAGARLVAVGERGIVLTSDDATRTWRQSPTPVSVSLTALRFADATRGYAVGHGGTVLATTDGGQSWASVLDGRKIAQLELEAAKATGEPAALKAAERLVADGADKPLLDLLALDAQRVVVVGAYGIALASEDGGATWTSWRSRLDNPKELHVYAVRKRGNAVVVAGEQGLLRWSNDGGKSFKALTPPYKGSFFTVELPADGEIVVAGLRGNVWRSTDNGATWTQIAIPVPASFTGSASRADGSLVLVNQAGMVLGLTQGTVLPMTTAALPPLNGVLALPDGALLVVSIQGAKLLDAAGATQQPQKSPAK